MSEAGGGPQAEEHSQEPSEQDAMGVAHGGGYSWRRGLRVRGPRDPQLSSFTWRFEGVTGAAVKVEAQRKFLAASSPGYWSKIPNASFSCFFLFFFF